MFQKLQIVIMFRFVVCFAVLSSALGGLVLPSPPQWDDRIVGGVETTIDEFPYQVSVLYIFRHICGGSIINENTVLTAAHCTEGRRPFTIQVKAGTTWKDNNKEPGKTYQVDKFIQHPQFTMQTVDCDISILKLKTPITFTDKIQPIPLGAAANGDVPSPGAQVIVTGWGAPQEGGHSVDILQKVTLTTISSSQCTASYGDRITNNMVCAQSPGKDACQGDSGGPVAYNGQLVGIVSWGIGCARPEYPGVFSKIAALRPWIDANINA